MTIRRDGKDREIVFVCDVGTCPTEFTLNDSSFNLTWAAAKREGWETKKMGSGQNAAWLHACPGCML
jgi:hypothetical protein